MSVARAAGSPVDHACDHLYRRHQLSLVNFARRRGCDEHEAWDVVQEVFLRVFRLGMIVVISERPVENQRSWLLLTLKSLLKNRYRNLHRLRRGGSQKIESLDLLAEDGVEIEVPATPATLHDKRWALSVIRRGLDRVRESLPPGVWQDLETSLHGQAARADTPPATSARRVAVHRLRKRLRDEICRETGFHHGRDCLYQALAA